MKKNVDTFRPSAEVMEAVKNTEAYRRLAELTPDAEEIAVALVEKGVTHYGSDIQKAWDAGFSFGITAMRTRAKSLT